MKISWSPDELCTQLERRTTTVVCVQCEETVCVSGAAVAIPFGEDGTA